MTANRRYTPANVNRNETTQTCVFRTTLISAKAIQDRPTTRLNLGSLGATPSAALMLPFLHRQFGHLLLRSFSGEDVKPISASIPILFRPRSGRIDPDLDQPFRTS